MSRKDFQAIADILKKEMPHIEITGRGGLENISRSLATYFKSQNERFDREKFLDACGSK